MFAPARHTCPYGTSPPQTLRSFTRGRWYLMVTLVIPILCVICAPWLWSGISSTSDCASAVRDNTTATINMNPHKPVLTKCLEIVLEIVLKLEIVWKLGTLMDMGNALLCELQPELR